MRPKLLQLLAALAPGLLAVPAGAVPFTDHPDIEIRNVLNLDRNTVRIAKDSREGERAPFFITDRWHNTDGKKLQYRRTDEPDSEWRDIT